MPRIDLRYLIKPNTTPEQELLLEHFYNQFDNGSAANRRIVNVEPLFYQGIIAGTEFLVYAATKLYLCYLMNLGGSGAGNGTPPNIILFDEANNNSYQNVNNTSYWDATAAAARFGSCEFNYINKYFSRFTFSGYSYMTFIGYRITLI